MPDAPSPLPRSIKVLDAAIARKIAAGEVIDRPAAVVRELLDNSLDANADEVEVELQGGGAELIRVVDNGHGMGREDLERCYLPHATSKIATDDDLLRVRSLGFRGEALSSIAAVSRLEITSSPRTGIPHRVRIEGGRVVANGPAAGAPGTRVAVADLFYNVPARKQFQKRSGSEFSVCRSVFLDRALAFPGNAFRLRSGGEMKILLPPSSLPERISSAYPSQVEPALLHELTAAGEGFHARIVAGEPGAPRRDRKALQVFVNRRRVWEYALVQAMEYAYREYLHGGLYPVAFLFLDVEPELVDFNVHPAKREVRFRNLPDIHRRIVRVLSDYLRVFDRRAAVRGEQLPFISENVAETRPPFDLRRVYSPPAHPADGPRDEVAATVERSGPAQRSTQSDASTHEDSSLSFRYLGQVMDLFLVVERAQRLYLVDQHAAHERIIYDRLRNGGSGQELLFPIHLEVESDGQAVLREQRETLRRMGIEIEERDGSWELVTVPSVVTIEAETLASLLMDLVDRPADFERELYASLSCRSAVMDGARLSTEDAERIIEGVMNLSNAVCPHGRPVWIAWSRDQLCSLVGRTPASTGSQSSRGPGSALRSPD